MKYNLISTVLTGVSIAVIAGLIISYFKRSKLIISVTANKRGLLENVYSEDINARITNIGHNKTEVRDSHLELRNGSETLIIDNVMQYRTIDSIESKSTIIYTINCSEVVRKHPFSDYSLIRVRISTTDDKVYNSNWLPINDVLRIWN